MPLRCTVRGCGEPLRRRDAVFACTRDHAFDVARSGYVNLLQPQDRRAAEPGDTREAVEARARLLGRGIGRPNIESILDRAADRTLAGGPPVVVELGCGGGDGIGRLAARLPIVGIGIDLSSAAVALAARRFPALTWVVANADRHLPVLDASVSLALSIHARRNPAECHRILIPGGLLVVAIPAPDDLIELREAVQGSGLERDRVEALIADHASHFRVVERSRVHETAACDHDAIVDLLQGTYRGARFREQARAARLGTLQVTLASDVLVFARLD